jgi:CubicO group peptidase (beta-lactamase class C family)
MAKHRSYSVEFKRQVAQEYLAGETLYNAGYLVLGLIIEQVTGEDYESAVRRLVMTPLGINRAHLTPTRRKDQRLDAVRHHTGGTGMPDLTLGPSGMRSGQFPGRAGREPVGFAPADR